MYSTLITAVALFAVPALASFAINDPELKQCAEAKISWAATKGPYNLIVVKADDPCGEPLVEIGDFEETSIQWKATIPAGTIVQVSVADQDDNEAWSKNITVAANTDGSCLTGGASTASIAGAGATDPAAPATGAAATTGGKTTTTPAGTSGNTTPAGGNTTPAGGSGSGSGILPVGAANAGSNKFLNAAPAARSLNGPVLVLSAIAAVAALAL